MPNHGDLITFLSPFKALPGQPAGLLQDITVLSPCTTRSYHLEQPLALNLPHVSVLPFAFSWIAPSPCPALCGGRADLIQPAFPRSSCRCFSLDSLNVREGQAMRKGEKGQSQNFPSAPLPGRGRQLLALSALSPAPQGSLWFQLAPGDPSPLALVTPPPSFVLPAERWELFTAVPNFSIALHSLPSNPA